MDEFDNMDTPCKAGVDDPPCVGAGFNLALVPPFVRRSRRISAALPWLYLKGIPPVDMREALAVLVGDRAKTLAMDAVLRLKVEWAVEYRGWMRRDLSARRYIYWWVDGIHTGLRQEDESRQCLLVIVGVMSDGRKELVAIGDGQRDSMESWIEMLFDLARRGMDVGPLLAVGDGALGFWAALDAVFPATRQQRCWMHKAGNVFNVLPKALAVGAKMDLQAIWVSPTRAKATAAFDRFLEVYGEKHPRAADRLAKDRDTLLAFYDFPLEHWIHLRTAHPVASAFATVRRRPNGTENIVSRATFLGLAFKLVREAETSWLRIRGVERIADLLEGAVFREGMPVSGTAAAPGLSS